MILFSRKKKIQRDRNAGLVFRWRGGYSGNTGGLTLAIILATSIFALGMLGIKVYVSSESPPSRYRSEIIQVSKIEPGLRWQLERNSPHLNSWGNNQNELGVIDVRDRMYDAIYSLSEDRISWNTVSFDQPTLETPRIYQGGKVTLPSLARLGFRHRHRLSNVALPDETDELSKIIWTFVLSSKDEAMLSRFPDMIEYPTNNRELLNYLGKTVKYTVNIDERGSVVSCLPLDWNTESEVKLIENWLNTVQFKEAQNGADAIETIIVYVTLNGREVAE